MIRVIIADDHPVVRAGLRQVISETPNLVVAGEVADGDELLAALEKDEFDVVLLDITMPGIGGIETLKRIKALKVTLPVLVLSVHSEEQFALRTIKSGASGYLTKASAPDELVKAIRQVVGGRKYISPGFAEKLATEVRHDIGRLPHERLSNRELQVLCMIASGRSVTGIASVLNISVKTVSTYRTRLGEKMGMRSNAEMIAYAVKNNLC